jgi:hypothetical protein
MTRVSAYIPGREQFRTDHGLAGTWWEEDHQPFYFSFFHILELIRDKFYMIPHLESRNKGRSN